MDIYIHYTTLPQDKLLPDVVEELNQVLEENALLIQGKDLRSAETLIFPLVLKGLSR